MAQAVYLQQNSPQLLGAGLKPDATIVSEGVEFPVHRDINCPELGYLTAAFNDNWVEASTNRVELREIDLDTTRKVIHFLYEGDYVTNLGAEFLPDKTQPRSFERDLRGYQSADYLMIDSMKDAVLREMIAFIHANKNLDAEVVASNLNMMYECTNPNNQDLRWRAYAAGAAIANAISDHEPELWTRIENMTEKLAEIPMPKANRVRHVRAFLNKWESAYWHRQPCRIIVTDMKAKKSYCRTATEGGVRTSVWCTNCYNSTIIERKPDSVPSLQRAISGLVIEGSQKGTSILGGVKSTSKVIQVYRGPEEQKLIKETVKTIVAQ